MKKETLVLVLVLCSAFIGVAAGCGDTSVDGPVPIMGTVGTDPTGATVTYNKDTCNSDADCGYEEMCQVDVAASKDVGYSISVCVLGCDADLETVDTEVKNEDGTSFVSSEVVKVEGTDTCQRNGDTTVYCDLTTHECEAYEDVTPTESTPEPSEPTEPEPVAELTQVTCCYSGDVAGLYGQLAWSTATSADPESWGAARDLEFDQYGCFGAQIDLEKVAIGFWVDATVGPHDGIPAEEVVWKGDTLKPKGCMVGGPSVTIGEFEADYGWPLYDAAVD